MCGFLRGAAPPLPFSSLAPRSRGPAGPGTRPRPFEITLETPKAGPDFLKRTALVVALQTILTQYRQFIAFAPNL